MIDLTQLAMLSVFPLSALALGLWALYLNRRRPEKELGRAAPEGTGLHEKLVDDGNAIKELEERVDRLNALLRREEASSVEGVRTIIVRNATTGQFRGAYRRTSRVAAHRIPAE